ncbi:MAG: 4Fe-4S dicluster domain-containing protein [Candidatus Heimdallarchaeota archaeon]|nr:MAG: 4Fe-4S dicluster domain-containing protein [Candidatus Heimdallarchaeota archaeon]
MGHKKGQEKNSYLQLQQRLDKSPQGAPTSKALFEILQVLFSEEEAHYVSLLPINFVTAEKAAKIWKTTRDKAEKILETLAGKGLLLDGCQDERRSYILAPTMAGFFEFSLMRTDGKFDRKILSELYYQYLNVEDDFLFAIFAAQTPIDRVFVQEETIRPEDYSEILDYERATKVIETAECITVGTCYCRHKMEHKGKACDMPKDVCLTFNGAAKSLSKHGIAKEISKEEAMKILDRVVELGLVQIGDNVQNEVAWICNCCGCCCEAILAYKRLGYNPGIYSNFKPKMVSENCNGCGVCVKKCPVDAIEILTEEDGKKYSVVDYSRCFGCGVCARSCKRDAIHMIRREDLMHTPEDAFERVVRMAIDKGKLQNLLFDNQHLWTHKMLQRFVGILLNLGPIRRKMADHQLQSKFVSYTRRLAKKRIKKLGIENGMIL